MRLSKRCRSKNPFLSNASSFHRRAAHYSALATVEWRRQLGAYEKLRVQHKGIETITSTTW